MRRKAFSIATLFVAAAISVAVVSCQKDNETENENQVVAKSANDESRELLNRIYAFQELRDNVRSGAKSGESMTLEQLRDDIDLTFNYEHSQHATPFANASLDTFYVRMPQVDANGNVSATEAIATYNAFETELAELMADVDDDSNLAKNFSIKFPETGAKSGDAIEVVFTRGNGTEKIPFYEPFEEGDDYYWGMDLGPCDLEGPFNIPTDAAQELSKLFKFTPDEEHEGMSYLLYQIEYVKYTSVNFYGQHDLEYVYYEDDNVPCADKWLFAEIGKITEEPCIHHDEMNCYHNIICRNIVYPQAPLHFGPETNAPYIECFIDDVYTIITLVLGGQPSQEARLHIACVSYGNVLWVDCSEENGNNEPSN
ncbi:MAG: hypothetical protein II981_10495 [Bacteroidales bacterium]|nr:hypothetical protein [Bacteroidales bacterium]